MLLAQEVRLGTFTPPSDVLAPADLATGAGATSKLESIISQVIGLLTVLGGIILIVYFIVAALNWISAAGDTGKIEKARNQMIQAISGMVILVAAYGLIGIISNFLGLSLLNPGNAILNIVQPGSAPTP